MGVPRYAVYKLGWYQPPHGDPYTRRLPTSELIETFDTSDEAEGARRGLETEARDGENPFRFGGGSVFFQSSLDGPRLHDWLMDAGIEPPASELRHSDWRAWWDAFAHVWSADQLAHAWAAFDKVRFFHVVEAAPYTAHVTLAVADQYDPNLVPLRTERGQLARVARKAPRWWAPHARGHSHQGREVLAIPSDVPPLAGEAFLVQRRVVLGQTFFGELNEAPANARVPLALFAERKSAEAERDRLAVQVRDALNPFVFTRPDAGVASADGRKALEALSFPLPLPEIDRQLVWLGFNWSEWMGSPVPDNAGRLNWLEWYDLIQDEATDAHRAVVWDLCEPPLFELLPVEVHDE